MQLVKSFQIMKNLVITILVIGSACVSAAIDVKNVRVWPSPDSTRVVLDLSKPVEYSYFTLNNPERLVIDLHDTKISAVLTDLAKDTNLLNTVRTSTPKKKGDARLVLDLNKKVEAMIFALKPTAPYSDRLVIDLVDSVAKVAHTKKQFKTDRDIVIAIDAGHGGEDPGSIGGRGNYEKRVTLGIAKKLEDLITKEPGMRAVMTRTGDYYLSVHKRTEKARDSDADLLISIHADAFTSPEPNGASVWVLNLRRANSEIGKWLEQKEKHSQLLGGAAEVIKNTTSERYLARTLLDMSMDHSMDQAHGVANSVLSELKSITKLHKRSPQAASLGVLKSPDIPSILVETGFISNLKEEKLLTNGWHQSRLANSIFKAVRGYFKHNPPDGTLFARTKNLKHKVKSGESLSLVAQSYNVSISSIKKANKLKSNMIRVGQVLSIPQS
ncbi:N-acetylmuramoyl-L-alanine amidase [Psychrosphaera sp. B3R10]|uniref:N-acetylmuramoyl-L-alanine amidase n=1 Tax=Psychrosphaera sp. B3R10 TaxID=2841569 RepID=UPI001C0925B2|nr:N-acetylmuramoyl-L-alanine amidase [Psychrosphaera sp. I2R16]MBU2989294.1 N-acetylmuramoyl-L-alanine amidase [Psychrosphaera sp. B3R10]